MIRALALTAGLFFAAPALACPMADAAAFAAAAEKVEAAKGTKINLTVEGMTCGDCSDKLSKKIGEMAGVNAVAADYQTGRTVVAVDASKVKAEAIIAVIKAEGYTASVSQS
ncbi:MAG: heavy-metal-associated domain-containing protein [Myxococcota bacterium]